RPSSWSTQAAMSIGIPSSHHARPHRPRLEKAQCAEVRGAVAKVEMGQAGVVPWYADAAASHRIRGWDGVVAAVGP
ncbi:hypothetical protein ACWGA9_45185, partial [Streptomyces sp. NPDC054950]